ncbi:DUF4111 domain-containing protein [Agrococcus sp. SGAir0287]|uniref:DUF4111 domain-containing protein n=1 Tax=Agrococcus sp. SGAir0287 TaxID=2070347 RepID=UPI0020C7B179|nr:DUF4111 domain-containing protein [Agrococcus sp. SGAir0287]
MDELDPAVVQAVAAYLRAADRLLPGRVVACAIAGSIALRAYRPGRSDIDLLVVLGGGAIRRRDMRRLRRLHRSQLPRIAARVVRGHGLSATCNASFVHVSELTRPVRAIRPIASHVGERFAVSEAFDVNPVVWRELVDGGVVLRGGPIAGWGLDPEPAALQAWCRENLEGYWRAQRDALAARRLPMSTATLEWCVLGPARLDATLVTHRILSKDQAGVVALARFPEAAGVVDVALAHLRDEPLPSEPPRAQWRDRTIALMTAILDAAGGPVRRGAAS